MEERRKPRIGITMGDPAGIGPEIVCKSLLEEAVYQCIPVVIGSREPLEMAVKAIGSGQKIRVISSTEEAVCDPAWINLIEVPLGYELRPGVIQTENGAAAISYMDKTYELLEAGQLDGTASAPCNKEAMKSAGLPCVGATEYYALLSGSGKPYPVVAQAGFYIFQATTHISLRQAIEKLTKDYIRDNIISSYRTLQEWGLPSPRMALSGFNPHAGDGGYMGREDLDILTPAIKEASEELCAEIEGPVPADALFKKGIQGACDGAIFLFHDTANIPIKLMEAYYPSVVITGGLPFIRVTVAHGTAYDIAYKGIAGHRQMCNAITEAARIVERLGMNRRS